MPNSSATGGYLAPVGVFPSSDLAFEVQLQALVKGITGIPGALVRPRWQPTPPPQPPPDVDWAAISVMTETPDGWAYSTFNAANTGTIVALNWVVELLCIFYGPNCGSNALRMRQGLMLPQNLEEMRLNNIALQGTGAVTHMGELVQQQYIRRADLPVQLTRQTNVEYTVLPLLEAEGLVNSTKASVPFNTTQ